MKLGLHRRHKKKAGKIEKRKGWGAEVAAHLLQKRSGATGGNGEHNCPLWLFWRENKIGGESTRHDDNAAQLTKKMRIRKNT